MYIERYPALSPPPSGKQIYAHDGERNGGSNPQTLPGLATDTDTSTGNLKSQCIVNCLFFDENIMDRYWNLSADKLQKANSSISGVSFCVARVSWKLDDIFTRQKSIDIYSVA